ncbi:MAG: TonB family protein [Acidobacteria bacterium]|nr:TonB family protein [Acidobacteriota bacterium]
MTDPLFAPTKCERKSKPKHPAVGGRPVLNNIIISQPAPEYPTEAKSAGVSGRVVVFACVDEEGRVYSARADAGNRLLLLAALKAVYKARLRAPTRRGKAVRVSGVVFYDFKLPEGGGRN